MDKIFKSWKVYIVLSLILLAHTIILTKVIFFPYPELFIYPYLTNHGLKPYSQILDQHFPGLMFFPINLDNLGMNNEFTARVWLIAIVLISQFLLFILAKSFFKNSKKALIINLLYLIWQPFFEGWVFWIDSLLPLFLIPACYFLYKRQYFKCGLFLGVAVVFKQTIIPLALLVSIYTYYQERRADKLTYYLLGLMAPIFSMLLYFTLIGVIGDFWYWTTIFNLTVYSKSGTQIPQTLGFVTRIILVYGFSLLILFHKDKKLKMSLLLFLVGSLAGAFDRANFVHFQPSLPFAIIGTVMGIYSLTKKRIILILVSSYSLIALWWLNIFYKGHLSDKVFFFDPQTKAVAERIRFYTKPYEKIFVFGAAPHLYQMSQTLPSGDIFVFQFPWFFQVAQKRILSGIEKDQPNIVVYDPTVTIEGVQITHFGSEINQYIVENYAKIDNVGEIEILKRK